MALLVVPPAWTAPEQGAWVPLDHLGLKSVKSVIEMGSDLIVIDSISARIVMFERPSADRAISAKRLPFRELDPTGLTPLLEVKLASTGYVQVAVHRASGLPQRVNWFGSNLEYRGTARFIAPENTDPIEDRVLVLYNWVVAGDYVFAYGAINRSRRNISNDSDTFEFGFFTFQLHAPGNTFARTMKGDIVETSEKFDYYLLGLPYVAAMRQQVYYLDMGAGFPALFVYDMQKRGRPQYLNGLPGDDVSLPVIDLGRQRFAVFNTIEAEGQSMPYGLYADANDGPLYLLRRLASDQAQWTMTKLRPDLDGGTVENVGTVRLETHADVSHVTVHFSKDSVLVFEKSAVRDDGTQDVRGMRVLPKTWVTEPADSPLQLDK